MERSNPPAGSSHSPRGPASAAPRAVQRQRSSTSDRGGGQTRGHILGETAALEYRTRGPVPQPKKPAVDHLNLSALSWVICERFFAELPPDLAKEGLQVGGKAGGSAQGRGSHCLPQCSPKR